MDVSLFQLYTHTQIAIARYQRDARSGRKDEAREFARYIRNSGITRILKAHEFAKEFLVDAAHLEWQLIQLEAECQGITDNLSDLAAIRTNLDLIAGYISKKL